MGIEMTFTGVLPVPEGVLSAAEGVLPEPEGVLPEPEGGLPVPEGVLLMARVVFPVCEMTFGWDVGAVRGLGEGGWRNAFWEADEGFGCLEGTLGDGMDAF